jgi:hypothetical protein
LVSLGVSWWTGSVLLSAVLGTLCGLAAAFAVTHCTPRCGERVKGSATKTIGLAAVESPINVGRQSDRDTGGG